MAEVCLPKGDHGEWGDVMIPSGVGYIVFSGSFYVALNAGVGRV